MFDYYRVRFKSLRSHGGELGYELAGPIAILGTAVFFLILYLTLDDFGWLMWKSAVPGPALCALATTVVLSLLAYIADELKRKGLMLLLCVAGLLLVAVVPASIWLRGHYADRAFYTQAEPPSAAAIGATFLVYLSVVCWLTWDRLRG